MRSTATRVNNMLTPGGVTYCKMVYGDAQRLKGGFSSFLVYRWVGFRSRPNPPNLQNWLYFGKFGQKSTQFAPNWVFFATNWYSDGSQNHAFRGIEMVDFPKSTLSIPVQFFLKNAPPAMLCPSERGIFNHDVIAF